MQDFATIPGLAGCIFGGASVSAGGGRLSGYSSPAAPVKCPRCDSTDTKFCYYNNYNLAQPRHFCKSCRRYWTKGGLLRNVPVGGGCRKSKRSSTSSSSSRPSANAAPNKDPSPRRSSPAADADAYATISLPNSSLSVANPDTGPIPTNSFEPVAPLVQAAKIFADTAAVAGSTTGLISGISAPMFSNFSRSQAMQIRHQTAAEKIGTGMQPGFMEHVAPMMALQLQSTAAEEVGMQPAFIEQATPLVPLQQAEAAGETGLQPVFIDRAEPPIPLQLHPAAEEVGVPQGFVNQAASAATGMEWSGAAVDAAFFGLPAAAYWGNSQWGDADPALYLA